MTPALARVRLPDLEVVYRHWPAPAIPKHPPVALLHGALQTGEGMMHLAERLAIDGEVLVPDLRGRGGSDQPVSDYRPATMAVDIAQLVEQLAIGPVVVVGRLHGGLVAYHLAARRPDLVLGLILGETMPEVSEDAAARLQRWVEVLPDEFANREDAERFYEETLRLSPARAHHDVPSDLVQTSDGRFRWRHNLETIARIEAAAMPRSDWEALAQVRCPALILRGQRGRIGPAISDRMVQTMASARAQTIYGAGHDVFLGPGAEQTLAAIQLFVRGLGNGR